MADRRHHGERDVPLRRRLHRDAGLERVGLELEPAQPGPPRVQRVRRLRRDLRREQRGGDDGEPAGATHGFFTMMMMVPMRVALGGPWHPAASHTPLGLEGGSVTVTVAGLAAVRAPAPVGEASLIAPRSASPPLVGGGGSDGPLTVAATSAGGAAAAAPAACEVCACCEAALKLGSRCAAAWKFCAAAPKSPRSCASRPRL